MKITLYIKAILVGTSLTLLSCNDPIKISSKDNTSRPAIPDNRGRNLGDDEVEVYDNARSNFDNSGESGTVGPTGKYENQATSDHNPH